MGKFLNKLSKKVKLISLTISIIVGLLGLFLGYVQFYKETNSIYENCINNNWDEVDRICLELNKDPGNRYAIERIPELQAKKCPRKPEFLSFRSIFESLYSDKILSEDINNKLKKQAERLKDNLQSLNLSGIILKDANMAGAVLRYTNLSNSKLYRVNLSDAKMERIKMSFSDARKSNMAGANFEGAKDMKNANFGKAILVASNFEEAKLEEVILSKADLTNSNLKRAVLLNSSLYKANLKNANLIEANLMNAYCRKANLEGANFSNAFLLFADFKKANFQNTVLDGAYLRKVNLEGAENLTVEQLCKTFTLESAKIDEELYSKVAKICPDKLANSSISKEKLFYGKWFLRYLFEKFPALYIGK